MNRLPELDNPRVAVIGLGYVGLPLAVEFGKHFATVGFDINESRIDVVRRPDLRALGGAKSAFPADRVDGRFRRAR